MRFERELTESTVTAHGLPVSCGTITRMHLSISTHLSDKYTHFEKHKIVDPGVDC